MKPLSGFRPCSVSMSVKLGPTIIATTIGSFMQLSLAPSSMVVVAASRSIGPASFGGKGWRIRLTIGLTQHYVGRKKVMRVRKHVLLRTLPWNESFSGPS